MPKHPWRVSYLLIAILLAGILSGCSEYEKSQTQRRVVANVLEADRQMTLGHPAQARAWYDRAIALAPHDADTYLGASSDDPTGSLVWSLSQHNDWPDMADCMGKASADPSLSGDWQIWANLAQAQDRLGEKEASRASYQRELAALAIPKRNGKVESMEPWAHLYQIASAEWGAGKQQQAIADYKKIIARYPQAAGVAQNALAYSEADANINLPDALTLATAAVKWARDNDPDGETLGESLDTLGWVEYRIGRYNDAVRDLSEALDDIPREPVSHYHLAKVYQALGQAPEAQIEIERASALCPSDADTQEALKQIEPAAARASNMFANG